MKIVYVAYNYEKYTRGYYYEDWVSFFSLFHCVSRLDPLSSSLAYSISILENCDCIIIGHSIFDKYSNFTNPIKSINNFFLSKIIKRFSKKIPVIFFSKNDYKADQYKWKSQFSEVFGTRLFVTHTLYALPYFNHYGKAIHVPFLSNPTRFYCKDMHRNVDIGYRGTLHDKWNFSIRSNLISQIQKFKSLKLDILPSEGLGANFLNGEEYNIWMNKCTLNLNTVSALGTVGPKFYEQFLTGVVPLAPIDWYEGLLLPNVNYIPSNDLNEIQLLHYLNDKTLINEIQSNNFRLISDNSIKKYINQILTEVF